MMSCRWYEGAALNETGLRKDEVRGVAAKNIACKATEFYIGHFVVLKQRHGDPCEADG